MISRGESWVLNRMAATIHRYPRYEEGVKVVTWSTGIRTCKGFRDFRLYCGDELVAAASSLWLYVHLKTKMLSRVPPDVAATFPSRPGDVFRPELDKLKLKPPAATTAGQAISVRYSDVDGNGHVNNTAYFDYLQTALPRSGASPRPQQIEIQFLKEIPPTAESVSVALEARGPAIAFGLSGPEGLFAQGLAG
ncbi:MAG TPA: acyl-ACP thioesterase domain-containing protein, partial [Opitutaceae bacterium]|nr:acyl-ACP thioesterase domain-containing protein [Opitutaceae bacterium]